MELKVQKSLNVVLQLDEDEATKVAAILYQTVDFDNVPLAKELYYALSAALEDSSPESKFRLAYVEGDDLFAPRGDK